jgi:hypothetical protein
MEGPGYRTSLHSTAICRAPSRRTVENALCRLWLRPYRVPFLWLRQAAEERGHVLQGFWKSGLRQCRRGPCHVFDVQREELRMKFDLSPPCCRNARYSADDTTRASQPLRFVFQPYRATLRPMTKLLDDAFRAVRNLPPDEQDNIARALLRLIGTGDEPPVALSVDERAAIAASKSAAARGEFASDEQVRAAWAKHGL